MVNHPNRSRPLREQNAELLAALKAYGVAAANIAEADHTVPLSRKDRNALNDAARLGAAAIAKAERHDYPRPVERLAVHAHAWEVVHGEVTCIICGEVQL